MYITTEQVYGKKIKVYADGESIGIFDSSFWYTLGIFDGDNVCEEDLNEIIKVSSFRRAYQAAINFLSYRAYSEKDLYDKLLLKEHSKDAADYAILRVTELGLINDSEYASDYAEFLHERKSYAQKRILIELKKKGINSDIASEVVENLEIDIHSSIMNLLNTKYINNLSDEKGKKRTFSALLRLGYEYEDIRTAFNAIEEFSD